MLRLAFTRPVRVLPPLARWQRFKSDGAVIPPSQSPSTAQSSRADNVADVAKPQKDISENAVELDISGLSIENQSRWEEEAQREFELAGVTEDQLSASIRSPPKLAETETELFGSTSQQDRENIMLDPKTLPRRVHLDPSVAEFTEVEYASALVHGRGIHRPFFHPRTHSIPAGSIHFRSHHPKLLDLFTHFATHAAYSLGIPVSIPYTLPTQRTLWTVLRSPFVHKKSQENFERRVHKRGIKAWDADPEVIDRWFKYLRRHAMGGVGMRMTKWERMPLGIGATRLAHVNDQLGGPDLADSAKIKALGDKIVMDEMSSVRKPDLTISTDKE